MVRETDSGMNRIGGRCAQILGLFLLLQEPSGAAESGTIDLSVTNGTKHLALPVVPAVDGFRVLRTTNLTEPFTLAPSGDISGYNWTQPVQGSGLEFFRVEIQPKDPEAVVNGSLLYRLGYGPTPDDIDRLAQIGADAYIQEQLAPETIQENLEIDRVIPATGDWQYVTQTGTASSSTLYIYLTQPGECYIDDIKLVRGAVAEAGANVLSNGDFENGLSNWTVAEIYTNSIATTLEKHGGTSSLHLIGTEGGSSSGTSIRRTGLGLAANQVYTLSYWYKPAGGTTKAPPLVIRLSGDGIRATPGNLATKLADGSGTLNDLTAWHVLHAVQSKKQLQEVMLQWLENHFVTQHTKTEDYFNGRVPDDTEDMVAANLEYRELQRWRAALQNPNVTFLDLLTISAESPAMIIYLDTVNSRGNGSNIANENYARELLELFTFGVDNGYDQNDITVLSRIWTGWSVRIVDPTNMFNPFAPQSTTLLPGSTNVGRTDNLEGVWTFVYKPENHDNSTKILFPAKSVPARFGNPYAGRDYELRVGGSAGTNSNWQHVTVTGTASSSTLYIYLTGTGDCYIDDIQIVPGTVAGAGTNAVPNGDFENGLSGWTVASNLSGSRAQSEVVHSGSQALHLVSTAGGSSSGTAIRRGNLGLASGEPYTLSYWFKPGTNLNSSLVMRLSGNGINSTPGGGTNTIQEGYQVLAHLADQPFTQEFISVKLCQLFVHDNFHTGYDFTDPNLSEEGKLVRACMAAWENNIPKGQIRKVLEVIFNSELFRSQNGTMQKVKTPFEYCVAAVRALRGQMEDTTYTAETDGYGLISPMNRMGRMRLFDRAEPDGYAESGVPWISAGTLTERLRFAQALMLPAGASGKNDAQNNTTDPVRLLKSKLPQESWNDANAVANYFLGVLFPTEGRANLDEYRQFAVWYLDTGDDGVVNSPFLSLSNTTAAYDTRVRGMVAMLMTFPRFQEQ
jgi:uncharacterized protein (DUF1800 family)